MRTTFVSIICGSFCLWAFNSAQAQCLPSPYIKNQTELAESLYKADKYDDFDQTDVALVNDQLYSSTHTLDNKNDYVICVFTNPGVRALAMQINNSEGRRVELIQTFTSVERNIIKFYFVPPDAGLYYIQAKVVCADNLSHCVRVLLLERDPDKN